MENLFNKFQELKSPSFISINNYENSNNELSNYTIIANASVENAKKKDLDSLKNCSLETLQKISKEKNLNQETLKTALSELISSAEKNLNTDLEKRSNQHKGQIDSYINVCPSIRLHKESVKLHISGFQKSKKILKEGQYPKTNKREKTLCKEAIKKELNLRMIKYRSFHLDKIKNVKITGDTINIQL